jgi:hypothetical protein
VIEPVQPARAVWVSRGLGADGTLDPRQPATFFAFPADPSKPGALRVEMTLVGVPQGPVKLEIRMGGQRRVESFGPADKRTVAFSVCPKNGRVTGSAHGLQEVVLPDARHWSGRFLAVRVVQQGSGC